MKKQAVSLSTLTAILAATLPLHAATFTTLYAPHGHKQGAEPNYIFGSGSTLYSDLEVDYKGQDSGSVLEIVPENGNILTLHAFRGPDGGLPTGLATHGSFSLVGTTLDGGLGYPGNAGFGVLFSIATNTFELKTLHKFTGAAGDGSNPANPVFGNNAIYGTLLSDGGTTPHRAIFSYDLASKTTKVLYSFTGGADGDQPVGLTVLPSAIAGVAAIGGAAGFGTVFAITPDNGQETTLYTFQGGADGANPASIIDGSPTTLYGTTSATIGAVTGTLFTIDAGTGALKTLHQFTADEGAQPTSLVKNGHLIYGVCETGGKFNAGSAFEYDIQGGKFHILRQFTGHADGKTPTSLTYSGSLNAIFGTTLDGGKGGGTVFRIDP